MGTEISLDIAGMQLCWSKNDRGIDHGFLFQANDRQWIRSDGIDYDREQDEGQRAEARAEMAFVRPLREVVPRLELLGFTIDAARENYDAAVATWRTDRENFSPLLDEPGPEIDPMSFDEYLAFATSVRLEELDRRYTFNEAPAANPVIRGRFTDDAVLSRIPGYEPHTTHAYSELTFFDSLVNIIHPYLVLRVLAERADNLGAPLVWHYGLLVENGWASESEFVGDARRTQTFLIATEGSSDAHILKHAFALLRPETADFFRLIDVSDGHPFPGTGNLLKFAEGLAKIDVQNQVLFLFDNDAEGLEAFQKLGKLSLPGNMGAMVLPDLEAFRAFPVRGPNGVGVADINGRAAAIECYLDHRLPAYPPPRVTWTNYKRTLDAYHGALDHKESYTKAFLDQTGETLASGGYDVSRLSAVLDALYAECRAIASRADGPAPETDPSAS